MYAAPVNVECHTRLKHAPFQPIFPQSTWLPAQVYKSAGQIERLQRMGMQHLNSSYPPAFAQQFNPHFADEDFV
ncbi:hypothetical protein TFLX_05919 [Thermoflexales bacterium]|nr:hypothetical protein TFLX_05919 [Thermoflexales bacterium]